MWLNMSDSFDIFFITWMMMILIYRYLWQIIQNIMMNILTVPYVMYTMISFNIFTHNTSNCKTECLWTDVVTNSRQTSINNSFLSKETSNENISQRFSIHICNYLRHLQPFIWTSSPKSGPQKRLTRLRISQRKTNEMQILS